MVILETCIFTERVQELLINEEYRQFQAALVLRLDLGPIIRGSEKRAG